MSFCLQIFVLMLSLYSCQSQLSVREPSTTNSDQTGKRNLCTEQTSPSPACPSYNNTNTNTNTNTNDGSDDPCSKDCDDICNSWGEVTNFTSYEGDVNTCTDNSYTLTRTGTRYRTCPDLTCDGAKKECLTTEEVTETKEKECRCSTVAGKKCYSVNVCRKYIQCTRDMDECKYTSGQKCIEWGKKEVCKDTDDGVVSCYDW